MELKDRLKKIMEQEFGITTDEQLNKAFREMDMSLMGLFTKGVENEKGDISNRGNYVLADAV